MKEFEMPIQNFIWGGRRQVRNSLPTLFVQRGLAPADPASLEKYRAFLLGLQNLDSQAADYVNTHLHRLARTLTLVPPPGKTSRALELGCYMQMTPALQFQLGYREIRGAYYGASKRCSASMRP
jgi:hypothetical protein